MTTLTFWSLLGSIWVCTAIACFCFGFERGEKRAIEEMKRKSQMMPPPRSWG